MEAWLENSGLTSTAEAAVEAVEAVLGSENLNSIREWIDSQPNITWLTDDDFLGAFAKLSTDDGEEARNRLQKLLTSQKEYSQWFENLDTTDPKIQEVFDDGYFLLLPERDDNGKQLYMIRLGYGSKEIDTDSFLRAVAIFFNYQFLVDYKGKTGTVAILDFAGTTFESFDSLVSLDVLGQWCHILASHYPSQITNLHFINCEEQIREKTVEAIRTPFNVETTESKIHSETLDELYKDVPLRCLPVEYLPADYTGPNAGTVQQIIEYTKSTLTNPEVRDRIAQLSHDQWSIDETQPTSAEQPSTPDDV